MGEPDKFHCGHNSIPLIDAQLKYFEKRVYAEDKEHPQGRQDK